ncbi:hypothetical protein [Halovivax cerinus]|uniref:Small CPxCG-related zinc finger protein n=1 Tax=Halovivax cerinus TaxID=1487865 RepID=A0ABD5NPE2_9EURY|nr:hypothetical protein [Halovivax cerinus]
MTRCYECSEVVDPRLAAVYVRPDEAVGLTLCFNCQTLYPRDRQYTPRRLPRLSCAPIEDGELP